MLTDGQHHSITRPFVVFFFFFFFFQNGRIKTVGNRIPVRVEGLKPAKCVRCKGYI